MRPLLVTSDPVLLDAVVAVAAEVRSELDVVPDVGAAARCWSEVPLVLLDAGLASTARLLPRRPGLIVVGSALDDVAVWREVTAIGADRVVELPADARWLAERLGHPGGSGAADVVAVLGASGGVGASTLAAAIARHASQPDRPSTLVDLDPGGGGLDLLLGVEQSRGPRWDELAGVSAHVDPRVLGDALPVVENVRLLSWSADASAEPDVTAVTKVVESLARTPGTLVLDAGRDLHSRAQALLPQCERIVLVVPLRVRAVTAARRVLGLLPSGPLPVLVCRGPAPGGVTASDVEGALGLPVTAVLSADRRRAEVEELGGGFPTGAMWRKACDAVSAAPLSVAA